MPRKEKKYHFIYKTTNLLSGKYYIGMHSTDNLEDGYLGSGKRLRYSINKHGVENHVREILEFVNSREELRKREEEIVSLNEIAKEKCMNLITGGKGGFSIETQKMGGAVMAKVINERFEKDEEFRKKCIKTRSETMKNNHKDGKVSQYDWTGKKHSNETKIKLSEAMKGKGVGKSNSQFGTCWINKQGVNKKIKKEDLETLIQQGWVKGRKIK